MATHIKSKGQQERSTSSGTGLPGVGVELLVKSGGHYINAVAFHKSLISWGRKNFRSYPWRMTNDPYHLLVAETMLHRTQAQQVVPVYSRFLRIFPDLQTLALASPGDLREAMYSLGLPERVNHFGQMIFDLMTRFEGQVPQDKASLISLSGISDYIASAVRCFAWNLPEPLIDTNTVRVIGRLFMLETKDSSRRNPLFRKLITALMDPDEPRAYNYALLDLADRVCTKKSAPNCMHCPVQRWCRYGTLALSIPGLLEVRKIKT